MSQHSGPPGSTTDAEPPHDGGPRVTGEELKDLARIRRSATDRKVAGVAAGLARHFDVDPVVVRVAFVVLALFGGGGFLLYGACWLFVPDERTHQAVINLDGRSRAIVLAVAGGLAALTVIGDSLGGFGFPWPIALVGLGFLIWYVLRNNPSQETSNVTATARAKADETANEAAVAARELANEVKSWFTDGDEQPGTPDDDTEPDGPAYHQYAPAEKIRDPRIRGPLLFGFTAALAGVTMGVLAMLQLAGVPIPASAYPAAAVACCGLMLLVGAFYGRGGGLILTGLVGVVATLVVASGADVDLRSFRMGQIHSEPASVADLGAHKLTMGEIKIDLTGLAWDELAPDEVAELDLTATMGHIEVIVPKDLGHHVEVVGKASMGEVRILNEKATGPTTLSTSLSGDSGDVVLRIDAKVTIGQIEIVEAQ